MLGREAGPHAASWSGAGQLYVRELRARTKPMLPCALPTQSREARDAPTLNSGGLAPPRTMLTKVACAAGGIGTRGELHKTRSRPQE
eukprot:7231736-Pyramimonas_sp.AAC.1